jgi:hypothetical protein
VPCRYCKAEYEYRNTDHWELYPPVALNEHGLCRKCAPQFVRGLPEGLTFENDHDRYVRMIEKYFEYTKQYKTQRKILFHVFKI